MKHIVQVPPGLLTDKLRLITLCSVAGAEAKYGAAGLFIFYIPQFVNI